MEKEIGSVATDLPVIPIEGTGLRPYAGFDFGKEQPKTEPSRIQERQQIVDQKVNALLATYGF